MRTSIAAALLASLSFTAGALAQPAAPDANLLSNPGFEQPLPAKGGPWLWSKGIVFGDGPVEGVHASEAAAHSGKLGLAMLKGKEPRRIAQQRMLLPGPDGWYEVSAWARTDGDGPALARLRVLADVRGILHSFTQPDPQGGPPWQNNGALSNACSDEVALTQEWQKVSFAFLYQKNKDQKAASAVRVQLVGWPLDGNVYFDDAEVKYLGEKIEAKPFKSVADGRTAPPAFATAPSPTVAGEIVVERPTLQSLSFEWPVRGDYNRNGVVEVTYRKAGAREWRRALPLLRMMHEVVDQDEWDEHGCSFVCPNQYAGSILNLEPGAEYEVHFKLTDPDGGGVERDLRASTRPWPKADGGGRKLHVYPPDFAGQKEEPSFIGLRAAYDKVEPGDVILVHAGQYVVPKEQEVGNCSYVLRKKGTYEKPIVIRAAGDGEAIFTESSHDVFNITGADYNTFDGLSSHACRRVFVCEGATGVTIRNCRLTDTKFGVWALGSSRDFTICDNVILGHLARKKDTHGVWLQGQGHVVCYNEIGNFWDGLDITGLPPDDPARRNCSIDFYNNLLRDCLDDCMETDYGVHNIRVFCNLCYNAHDAISTQPVYGGPVYICRNVLFNTDDPAFKINNWPAGLMIFNNTLLNKAGFCSSSMWQNTAVMNNLIFSEGRGPIWTGTPTPETSRLDYNGLNKAEKPVLWQFFRPWRHDVKEYMNGTYTDRAGFARDTGYEAHGAWGLGFDAFARLSAETYKGLNYRRAKNADENAVDFKSFDLRPRDGGPAIDVGAELPTITDGFTGKAPDLGAYELGQPMPIYGPRHRAQ